MRIQFSKFGWTTFSLKSTMFSLCSCALEDSILAPITIRSRAIRSFMADMPTCEQALLATDAQLKVDGLFVWKLDGWFGCLIPHSPNWCPRQARAGPLTPHFVQISCPLSNCFDVHYNSYSIHGLFVLSSALLKRTNKGSWWYVEDVKVATRNDFFSKFELPYVTRRSAQQSSGCWEESIVFSIGTKKSSISSRMSASGWTDVLSDSYSLPT